MDKETIRTLLAVPEAEQEIPEGTWRRASVLSLFMEREGELSLLFTRRTTHVMDHKGQVSFPGGAVEPEDQSLEAAALRETLEEIGIQSSDIEILGRSRDMFTISGWWITPVVGWYAHQNGYTLNPAEVSRVFSIPADWLCRKANWDVKTYVRNGVLRTNVIFYHSYDGETLWGITAQLVHDLFQKLALLEE
jgi:8-oxo-dGTP pyrophosphatase MutT (NUDIX family)